MDFHGWWESIGGRLKRCFLRAKPQILEKSLIRNSWAIVITRIYLVGIVHEGDHFRARSNNRQSLWGGPRAAFYVVLKWTEGFGLKPCSS